jgi:ABC-type dipeptide/oligopeptide/nickel transport system ATPase subunit/predicted phosphodiesterase
MIKIAHMADIQVRALKRHKEFVAHFENLYASLREQNPDIIAICGDIAHQKLIMSPELVAILSDLFKNLSEIAPLHLIAGNHDALIGQESRLDVLTPIVDNLKNQYPIYYYKHSGIYPIDDNHEFVVFGCLDDEEDWPKKHEINKNKVNIGLYHGMVDGCVLDNGFVMSNTGYGLDYFMDFVDYLLMGDIHKRQSFANGRAQYSGSNPQQNYAESRDKGYLIWNIKDKDDFEAKFNELPNVCPFYTIKLDDQLDFKSIPSEDIKKGSRIRIICREVNVAEKKEIREKIQALFEPIEIKFHDQSNISAKDVVIDGKEAKADSLENVEIQEKLIKNHLKQYNLSKSILDLICELNRKYDKDVKAQDDTLKNVVVNLQEMRFSNMMSFGEDNVFNFAENKGLIGVMGSNGVGKSSVLVDIPLYCLCNKISKKGVVKNDLLINDTKDTCSADITATINKDTLKINRSTSVYLKAGKKKKEPVYQGKTDVDFKVYRNGSVIDMNGSERSETDKHIKSFIGDMETLTRTSIAPQWQLLGLLDAGGTDRLKIISSYFGIDAFEKKHALAKEDQRDIKALIKSVDGIDFEKEIIKLQEEIDEKNTELDEIKSANVILEAKKEKLSNELARMEILQENTALMEKLSKFKSVLRDLETKRSFYEKNKQKIEKNIARLGNYSCISNANCSLLVELKSNKESLEESNQEIEAAKNKIDISKKKIKEIEAQIVREKEEKKESDKQKQLRSELNNTTREIRSHAANESTLIRAMAKLEGQIEGVEKQKKTFYDNKDRFDAYDYYLKAMAKDGIVKKIISDNVGIINKELDKILSETVSFRAEIASERNGKEVEIFFIPNRGEKRRIELCSGMQKSIVAVALRIVLVRITTLPKLNVLILDEPISALDDEHMESFSKLLDYAKNYFDTIFIISHNEQIKGFCDTTYMIEFDERGYARIY